MKKVVLHRTTVDGVVYEIVANAVDPDSFTTGAETIEQVVSVIARPEKS